MADRLVPSQSYYPSAKLRLAIRFEDFGSRLLPAAPKKPLTKRGASKSPPLNVVRDGDRFVLSSKEGGGTTAGGTPQEQYTSSDGYTRAVGAIIPVSATWKVQGLKEGNRLTAELRYADFPLDPRAIRAIAIQFYLGTVTPENFVAGLAGGKRGDEFGKNDANAGEPLHVVADKYVDDWGHDRKNLRFEGFVDDIETEFPEDDEPIVRFECSDNMRILVDQLAPPGLTLDTKKPIDEAIANYMAEFPQLRGMGVQYRPAGTTPPTLSSAYGKTAYQPKLGPPPGKGGDSKLTVWEYIVDVCGAVGHIATVEGTTVIIQAAMTLYSNAYAVRSDDPYVPRKLKGSGLLLPHRTLIYGRNLSTLSIRRRFSRQVPTNIEVRAYDSARKKTLVARYPLAADRVLRAPPGNNTDEKWQVVRISGVKDEKSLRLVAQTYYETQGRNEIQVRCSTKDLASYGGGNNDPDLLDLQYGDPIDIGIDRDRIYAAGAVEDTTTTSAADALKKLGYSTDFANTYATAINNVGLQKTFRLRTMQVDWSNDADGVSIDIEAINYVEVRAEKILPAGEQAQPPPAPDVTPRTVAVEDE